MNSLRREIVFCRNFESARDRRRFWSISFIFLLVVQASCGFWPSKGKIIAFKGPDGLNSVYGIVGDVNRGSGSSQPILMALPTGFEKRLDVVRDLEEIWAPQATNRGWVIVCPASSSGFPFGVSKVAGFGLGAERLVPYLIDDLRKKGLLNQDGGAFLVDLWGGGRGAISVARQAPGTFRHVILAPSATVDMDLIREYDGGSGPKLTIILGHGGHKKIDDWLDTRGQHTETDMIDVLRIPVKPPFRTDSTERSMGEIGADYAIHICDYIEQKFLTNSSPTSTPTPKGAT